MKCTHWRCLARKKQIEFTKQELEVHLIEVHQWSIEEVEDYLRTSASKAKGE